MDSFIRLKSRLWRKGKLGIVGTLFIASFLLASLGGISAVMPDNRSTLPSSTPRAAAENNTLPTVVGPADFSYYTTAEIKTITWVVSDPDIGIGASVEVRRDGVVLFTEDFENNGQEITAKCQDDSLGVHAYAIYVDDGFTGLILRDTVQVTALDVEADADFDDLSDYEELRIYGSDPNNAASPDWNIGHFNFDIVGSAPSGWGIYRGYGSAQVLSLPSLVGTDGSNLVQIFTGWSDLGSSMWIERSVSLGQPTSNLGYLAFQLGSSGLVQYDMGVSVNVEVVTDEWCENKWTTLIAWDSTWVLYTNAGGSVIRSNNLGSNQLHLFEFVMDFTLRTYNLYIDRQLIYRVDKIDPTFNLALPVGVETITGMSTLRFAITTSNNYGGYAYIDNVRAGNVVAVDETLYQNAKIPIITTKLYAPPVGGPGSYQEIRTTQSLSLTTKASLNIEGTAYWFTGSAGVSVEKTLTVSDWFTWTATVETGDKWCGIELHGDIKRAGLRFLSALNPHIYTTAFEIYSSYSYQFQWNLDEFYAEFGDYYPQCHSAEELLPFLPDPKVKAIYGPEGNVVTHGAGFGYPYEETGHGETATSIETWNVGGGFEFEDATETFSFKMSLNYESTTMTSLSYDWSVKIYVPIQGTRYRLNCDNFKDYHNIGFWFVDQSDGSTDTTPPLLNIRHVGGSTDGAPGQWIVYAADPESEIASMVVKVDGTQAGTTAGTYAVPNTLGTHTIEVLAINGETLTVSRSSLINIVDDDPTPPAILIQTSGGSTDGAPGQWSIIALDSKSGIASVVVKVDGTQVGTTLGTYAVPNTLGTHTIEVQVSNGDLDRANDQQTATASSAKYITDDDTSAPSWSFTSYAINWPWGSTCCCQVSDPSGVYAVYVLWSDGVQRPCHYDGGTQWADDYWWALVHPDRFLVYDNDNDRANDMLYQYYYTGI